MRQGNTLNIVIICLFLAFTYLGSIVLEDAFKPNSESNTAKALVGQLTCGVVCPTVESRLKALENTVAAQQTTIDMQQDTIESLQSQLAAAQPGINLAEQLTECVSTDPKEINGLSGPHVIFEGCNVHVRDGSSTTDGPMNGLGNLVIGYNEDNFGGPNGRSGSHNLIVGPEHSYSSFGGFVAGFFNTISGEHSSVSGGHFNIASGMKSSVSGGAGNEASSELSSVSGGANRDASGDFDWAAGSLFENQ